MSETRISLIRSQPDGPPACLQLELSGMLDSQNARSLPAAIQKLAQAEHEITEIRLDLSGLHYASSTGIGALINSTLQLRRSDIVLVLKDTPEHIMTVIDLLGFTGSLHFHQSEAKN